MTLRAEHGGSDGWLGKCGRPPDQGNHVEAEALTGAEVPQAPGPSIRRTGRPAGPSAVPSRPTSRYVPGFVAPTISWVFSLYRYSEWESWVRWLNPHL